LKAGKEVEYGFLGVGLKGAPGAVVDRTQPGTPAEQAGMVTGDEIIAVDDTPVHDADGLILALSGRSVGSPTRLKIRRQDHLVEKAIILGKFRVEGEVIATNRLAPWRGLRIDHLSTLSLQFGQFDLDPDSLIATRNGGVGILEVLPGSPAELAGLRAGQ